MKTINATCARLKRLWLLPVISLSACATPSPPSVVEPPKLPAPPAQILEPLPPPGWYSKSAEQNMLKWQELLTNSAPAFDLPPDTPER